MPQNSRFNKAQSLIQRIAGDDFHAQTPVQRGNSVEICVYHKDFFKVGLTLIFDADEILRAARYSEDGFSQDEVCQRIVEASEIALDAAKEFCISCGKANIECASWELKIPGRGKMSCP